MFAILANIQNTWHLKHLPLRGFPEDTCDETKSCYSYDLIEDFIEVEPTDERIINKSTAEKWVNKGLSTYIEVFGCKMVTSPEYHSPNWCTTKEMEECINKIFLKNGNYTGNYIEWLALLGTMKGYEYSGEYECRAIYWFNH